LLLLASSGDRLLELRIELESQTAVRARQKDSNSSCRSRDRAFKQSRNAPGEIQSGGTALKKISLAAALSALAIAAIISNSSLAARAQQTPPATHQKLDELIKKGDDLFRGNKLKEAIEAYKEALALDPNNDQAVAYIAYSYNKLRENEQARQWMTRRVEIPGQTASKKAQALTDITLLYWDEAHMDIASRLAGGSKNAKPEDVASAKKMLTAGIEAGQRAVAIAPRSVKGFNLLNLLYRASAATEPNAAIRTDLNAKADAALRKSLEIFEAIAQQPSADLWVVPTLSAINGTDLGQSVHFGSATKKTSPDALKGAKEGAVVVEVVVGRDGKVRLPRLLAGQGKLGEAAVAAARQWEFEPGTFEGHAVQVIQTVSFPAK
jgi:TonB family protein